MKKYFNVEDKNETVLINSNFTCNYFIDREKLFNILKYKYKIKSNYDSCSYPGILCRKYKHKDYTLSFMIFRTGSVLIVGKCEIDVIQEVYEFNIHDEYYEIRILIRKMPSKLINWTMNVRTRPSIKRKRKKLSMFKTLNHYIS